MHSSIALLSALAASAIAKTVTVTVGQGGLVFKPDLIAADVGDVVEFHFYGSFHTAVQGDFSTPCARGSLAGTGFNSGPINNMADGTPNVFQVTVKSTDPMWFYCSTPSHCQSGMSGVINPPNSGGNSIGTYRTNAEGTTSSEGSSTVQGGVVAQAGSSSGSGSSSGAAAAPSSSSAPMMSSAAAGATTTSAGPASSSSAAASAASSAASSKPASSSASGAGGPQGMVAVGGSALLSLAFGVGVLAFFMA